MSSTAPKAKTAPAATDRLDVRTVWAALRPRQWAKNGALLTAPLFARRLTDPWSDVQVLIATGVFCCLASAVYLVNDVADREADRHHPEKSRRPVAAGTMSVAFALTLAGTPPACPRSAPRSQASRTSSRCRSGGAGQPRAHG